MATPTSTPTADAQPADAASGAVRPLTESSSAFKSAEGSKSGNQTPEQPKQPLASKNESSSASKGSKASKSSQESTASASSSNPPYSSNSNGSSTKTPTAEKTPKATPTEEQKAMLVDPSMADPKAEEALKGDLWKKGKGLFKRESKRSFWFSDDRTILYYAKIHDDPKKKSIVLTNVKAEKKKDPKNAKKFWIHLDSDDKKVKKTLRDIACVSAEEREKWLLALSGVKPTEGEPLEETPVVENMDHPADPASSTSSSNPTGSQTGSQSSGTNTGSESSSSHPEGDSVGSTGSGSKGPGTSSPSVSSSA